MRYCPKCDKEYDNSFMICLNCKCQLIAVSLKKIKEKNVEQSTISDLSKGSTVLDVMQNDVMDKKRKKYFINKISSFGWKIFFLIALVDAIGQLIIGIEFHNIFLGIAHLVWFIIFVGGNKEFQLGQKIVLLFVSALLLLGISLAIMMTIGYVSMFVSR